jgi:excisionase family DNA binding protein
MDAVSGDALGMKTYTTTEAAKKLGISRETLYQWLRAGKIPAPQQIRLGTKTQYLWSEKDIQATKAARRKA